MGQRGLRRTVFVKRRTLSTMPMTLRLGLVASIGADVVKLQCGPKLLRLENEGLAERLNIACLGLAIALPFPLELPLLALLLLLMLVLAQPLLEEGGYGVCDALELLVALRLGCLETTCDMSPDEGHGHGVEAGSMGGAYAAACAGLGLDGIEDGLWREYEGTWRLSSRQARVGHVGAVVCGRYGGTVVARRRARSDA